MRPLSRKASLPDFIDVEKSQSVKTSASLTDVWCILQSAEFMNFFNRVLAAGLCLAAALSVPASAGAPARVLGADVSAAGGRTEVSVTVDRAVDARVFLLSGPDRFVIDVPGARADGALAPAPAGAVRGVRHARQPDGAMRVVFDLSASTRVGARRVEDLEGGAFRFVFELVDPAGETARPAARRPATPTVAPTRTVTPRTAAPVVYANAAVSPAASTAPREMTPAVARTPARTERASATARPAPPEDRTGRRVIVIDAGHGGHDPGAIGRSGLREKDVVLAAARDLRDHLEARGGYKVIMTRDGDGYIAHDDRVAVGRREKADLFISLHADAHANPSARGASVYTLSASGEARARNMMGRKDWEVDLGDAPRDERIQSILVNLTQRETTSRSAEFAQTLIAELGREAPLLRNTHRSAGFYVLLAPDVPAVLLELGFLTNQADESRLADPAVRRRMTGAVADSIDVYFARSRAYAER